MNVRRGTSGLVAGALVALLVACGSETTEPLGTSSEDLTAVCDANVKTIGLVPTETDYLPHVVQCENGGAPTEALKAQAIVARTYLYYEMAKYGSIADGQGAQVYSCSKTPSAAQKQAVTDTSGLILQYKATTICSFFVAGGLAQPTACKGGSDPTSTEQYVTYNDGKSGTGITQSSIGFVSPTNYENRGCMSQNGSSCLANEGKTYVDILKFYFGADIQLVQATGACVTPVGAPDGGGTEGGTSSEAGSSADGGNGGSGGNGGDASAAADGGATPSLPGPAFGDPGASGGCGCRAERGGHGPAGDLAGGALVALVAGAFVRRRRTRA
jgi:MYXO-CTERM domain-containing protein